MVIEAAVYILKLTDYLGILNLLSMSERQETIWLLKIVCVNIQRKKVEKNRLNRNEKMGGRIRAQPLKYLHIPVASGHLQLNCPNKIILCKNFFVQILSLWSGDNCSDLFVFRELSTMFSSLNNSRNWMISKLGH